VSEPNSGLFPKIIIFQNKNKKNKIKVGNVEKADQRGLQK
jgi:hypothetical protein